LTLLVAGVAADHPDDATTAHDLAVLADAADAGSDLHGWSRFLDSRSVVMVVVGWSLPGWLAAAWLAQGFGSIDDARLVRIEGARFDDHHVPWAQAGERHAQITGHVSRQLAAVMPA